MNVDDLKAGDVLLYSSQSWIGKLIRMIDGTEVTHAGVYLGDGQVGEALMVGNPGINANPFSLAGTNWIDVRRLDDSSLTPQPILTVADHYIAAGNRYAYVEILLLAIILISRKVGLKDPRLVTITFWVMKKVNDWIEDMFDHGREPMICSEFVYRCYNEAVCEDDYPYTLDILSQTDGVPRRRYSDNRRGERVSADRPVTELPTVHPDSLLAKSLNDLSAFKATGAAAPDFPLTISDEELDGLIADYLGEEKQPSLEARSGSVTAPVTIKQLEQAVVEYVKKLGSFQRYSHGAIAGSADSVESRVSAVVADFVTPG